MLSLFTSHKFHLNEFAKQAKAQNKTIGYREIYQYFSVKKMSVNITA
jgi:hypothetical protein